jgi:hypothetical protein
MTTLQSHSLAALTTPAVPALSPYAECRLALDRFDEQPHTARACLDVLIGHGWQEGGRETITGFLERLREKGGRS